MSDKKDIKIADAFKDGKAFIGFLTAGDPTIEKTVGRDRNSIFRSCS